jgi:hypothetical protein
MKSICSPATAFCLLPTAYCVSGEFDSAGLSPRSTTYDRMSLPTGKERSSNFKN